MSGQNGRSEWSLVFFTILTQMAVGMFSIWGLDWMLTPNANSLPVNFTQSILWVTLISLVVGGISAFLHLGNPFRVGFALSNFRSSWLSREGVLSGMFGALVFVLLIANILELKSVIWGKLIIILAILSGWFLVYGISRLYMLRTVPAWNNFGTPATFFTSSLLLGAIVNLAIWIGLTAESSLQWTDDGVIVFLGGGIVLMAILQLAINTLTMINLSSRGGAGSVSVRHLWLNLRGPLIVRWLTAFVGIKILFLSLIYLWPALAFYTSFALVLISEILSRYLFYGYYQRVGY